MQTTTIITTTTTLTTTTTPTTSTKQNAADTPTDHCKRGNFASAVESLTSTGTASAIEHTRMLCQINIIYWQI
jgi:hypothetical protein